MVQGVKWSDCWCLVATVGMETSVETVGHSPGSGILYISCTRSSCAVVHELLHASCPTAPVMAPSLAGICTVSGHCPFTSTSLACRDVALVETGWYLDVYEADVLRIPVLDDLFCLCITWSFDHSWGLLRRTVFLGEHMKTLFIVMTNNSAEKCVTPGNGDIHSQKLNVVGLGHKTFWTYSLQQ